MPNQTNLHPAQLRYKMPTKEFVIVWAEEAKKAFTKANQEGHLTPVLMLDDLCSALAVVLDRDSSNQVEVDGVKPTIKKSSVKAKCLDLNRKVFGTMDPPMKLLMPVDSEAPPRKSALEHLEDAGLLQVLRKKK